MPRRHTRLATDAYDEHHDEPGRIPVRRLDRGDGHGDVVADELEAAQHWDERTWRS